MEPVSLGKTRQKSGNSTSWSSMRFLDPLLVCRRQTADENRGSAPQLQLTATTNRKQLFTMATETAQSAD